MAISPDVAETESEATTTPATNTAVATACQEFTSEWTNMASESAKTLMS
jgi:hypothetical protein